MDENGETTTPKFTFTPGTEVYASCSITHKGTHYVFGGAQDKRQISRIENCSLGLG